MNRKAQQVDNDFGNVAGGKAIANGGFSIGKLHLSKPQALYLAGMAGLALAMAYPLITLAQYMLGVDYYQHFPLLIVGAVGLAVVRVRANPVLFQGEFTWRVLVFSVLSVGLAVGIFVIPSRWLGTLAMLALLIALVNFWGGRRLALLFFGPFLLLCAAVPLPVHFDNWFVVALQNLATRLASIWLDLAGVLHFTTGVSIQTAEHSYYVKDACSGIHSVFAAIAVGMGYAVVRNYRVLGVCLFLLQLLFWVVIANGARVFLTIFLQIRYGLDLVDGAYHELLGMVTFAIGVLLAISGDRLLRYFFPRDSVGESDSWSQRFSQLRERRYLDAKVTPRLAVACLAVVLMTGAASAATFYRYKAPRRVQMTREELVGSAFFDVAKLDRAALPESIGDDWRVTNFFREDRDEKSLFGGLVSLVWECTHKSGRRVLISLDGAYDNWHDLSVCYSGAGWHIDNMQTLASERNGEQLFACELALDRDPIDHAQVVYICIDPAGGDVKPPEYFGNAFMSLAKRFGIGTQDRESYEGGVLQLQMLDDRPGAFTEEQLEENRELFWNVVNHVFLERK